MTQALPPSRLSVVLVLLATLSVASPALAEPPGPSAAPEGEPPAVVVADAAPPTESSSISRGTLGLGLGIAGLVGVGVGSIFGVLANGAWSNATAGCRGGDAMHCVASDPAQVRSDHDSAQTDATVSTVAFVSGGILIAAGGALLLSTIHHGDGGGGSAMRLAPAVGPNQAGLTLGGTF